MKQYILALKSILLLALLISVETNMQAKDIFVSPGPSAIQDAVDSSKDGDIIYLNTGIYFESIVIRKRNLTIKPASGAKVEITSAYPEYFNHTIQWKKEETKTHPRTGKSYSIYTAQYPRYATFKKSRSFPGYGYVADAQDILYFSYRDPVSFSYQYAAQSEVRGVFFGADKIYLATEINPNSESLFVSRRRIIEFNKASNITIDGGERKSITLKNGGRFGLIINQLFGEKSSIKNVRFINSHSGIFINQLVNSSLFIQDNLFIQHLEELPWMFQKYGLTKEAGVKSGALAKINANRSLSVTNMETTAICANQNKNGKVIVDNNSIYGYFNGIVSYTNDVEIKNNNLSDIRDDAIEIEGNTPNNLIHNNSINCSFVGISLTPIRKGPVFVFNNQVIANYSSIIWNQTFDSGKLSYKNVKVIKFTGLTEKDKTQDVHIYHNTFFSLDNVLDIGSKTKPQFNPRNSTFYNNLFLSKRSISNSYGRPSDGIDYQGNVFNSSVRSNSKEDIPRARQWNNTVIRGSEKSGIRNAVLHKIPSHYPHAKALMEENKIGAAKTK